MSIRSEIDRISVAKNAIKSAIEAKGVTVPDTATLSDYPAKIAEIQTGAQLPSGGEPGQVLTVSESGLEWSSIPTATDKTYGLVKFATSEQVAFENTYSTLEYIESTGTQYIDTGFKPGNDTRVVIDCQIMSASGSFQGIAAARDGGSSACFAIWMTATMGAFRSDFGNDKKEFNASNSRHVFEKDGKTTKVDGVVVATNEEATFTTPASLFLFAGNTGGRVSEYAHMRLYSCKIYDGGSLVREFYPTLRDDGSVGLYDYVDGKFYKNSGTGTFNDGPVDSSGKTGRAVTSSLAFGKELLFEGSAAREAIDSADFAKYSKLIVCFGDSSYDQSNYRAPRVIVANRAHMENDGGCINFSGVSCSNSNSGSCLFTFDAYANVTTGVLYPVSTYFLLSHSFSSISNTSFMSINKIYGVL